MPRDGCGMQGSKFTAAKRVYYGARKSMMPLRN